MITRPERRTLGTLEVEQLESLRVPDFPRARTRALAVDTFETTGPDSRDARQTVAYALRSGRAKDIMALSPEALHLANVTPAERVELLQILTGPRRIPFSNRGSHTLAILGLLYQSPPHEMPDVVQTLGWRGIVHLIDQVREQIEQDRALASGPDVMRGSETAALRSGARSLPSVRDHAMPNYVRWLTDAFEKACIT